MAPAKPALELGFSDTPHAVLNSLERH